MVTTKELRLNAFIEIAKNFKSGKGLGLTLENFIVLVDNIQFKYGYTDEDMKLIWDIINPPAQKNNEQSETPIE